ncbi:MAG: futalosine hydrolase [Bacteroidia bacterium]|jgi:futalosine hydrolase
MKILVVSATKFEVAPLLEKLNESHANGRISSGLYRGNEISILVTGIGMTATAYYTGKVLDGSFDFAMNLGVCGSFNKNLEIGTVVNVYEDQFSELGAEDGDAFLSLADLKLEGISKIQNNSGALHVEIEKLPKVSGITVNTVHGNEKSIERIWSRYRPYVESMEGAAFMFACEQERIPYIQIRAVSNLVEKRNREAWDLPLAIKNLNSTVQAILDVL